jgi:hypothetical protein
MGQRYSLSIRLVCSARISSAEARSGITGGIGGNDGAAICQNEKLFLQRGDENGDSYGPRSHAAR